MHVRCKTCTLVLPFTSGELGIVHLDFDLPETLDDEESFARKSVKHGSFFHPWKYTQHAKHESWAYCVHLMKAIILQEALLSNKWYFSMLKNELNKMTS